MKVSVVIQRLPLLQRCLEALIQQDFAMSDYEIIVVTDGPDNATRNLIRQFNRQHHTVVQCYSLPVKRGPAAARNIGWRLAAADFVLFTDDDCIPAKQWISSYWNAYTPSGNNLCAFTGKVIVPLDVLQPTDYERNVAQLAVAEFITANCACTVATLEYIHGFDEDFSMAYREDSDLHFKLLSHQVCITHVAAAEVCHPVRAAHWGVSLKEQQKSRFNALLYKKHPFLYKEKIGVQPLWNYYFMIAFFLLMLLSVAKGFNTAAWVSVIMWLLLVTGFTIKRLQHTRKSLAHVLEMFATSLIIPFLSVYWTLYGAVRYRVWLL
jgi:glycosyltransferase involved in cell wall biosynthesis